MDPHEASVVVDKNGPAVAINQTAFDLEQSSEEVTVLRGQTALLVCVVRHVNNRTVSFSSIESSYFLGSRKRIA
jgi:hypothetical protein